jgi:hypothetical protein
MKRKNSRNRPDGLRLFQVFRHDDGTHTTILEAAPISVEGFEFVGQVRAKNFLEAHVAVVGELPQLDEPIKPLVLLLNSLGFWTLYCCSGHQTEHDDGGHGYIFLHIEQVESLRRLKQLMADILDDDEDGPCDCEGPCEYGHEPLRFLRQRTAPLPAPNMVVTLALELAATNRHGEWGLSMRFSGINRPLSALDYAWLVEQIELRTGRAKPLPPSAPSAPRKSPLTLSRL